MGSHYELRFHQGLNPDSLFAMLWLVTVLSYHLGYGSSWSKVPPQIIGRQITQSSRSWAALESRKPATEDCMGQELEVQGELQQPRLLIATPHAQLASQHTCSLADHPMS